MDVCKLLNLIVKSGLTTYKAKNSKASLPLRVAAEKDDKKHKKGAVFAVRDKSHFDITSGKVMGYIITSKETLLEDSEQLTHWTPNVYRTFGYSDEKRMFIKGFEERNLLQINTFVVDIDTKAYSVQEILMTCLDDSIGIPTAIVETARGYQVYFVLSEPFFISNKNEFRGLKVAKRISDNIKRSLKSVDADPFCNDFGFFRMPTSRNLVFFQSDITYTTADLIKFSMKRDDDVKRRLFVVPGNKAAHHSVTQSEWFQALIHAVDVKGKKGQIGRNNAIFTLALICFSESWEKERTYNFLDEFNTNLNNSLKTETVRTIIESAYSGKYKGASKEYIEELLNLYVPGQTFEVSVGQTRWYKFKKEREQRERSHYNELEQDIIEYITAEFNPSEPFIWRTQKELCEAVGIAQSSLNALLKRSTKLIKTVQGKGRSARTGWTTVNLFIQYVLKTMQAAKEAYRDIIKKEIIAMTNEMIYSTAVVNLLNYLETNILHLTSTLLDEIGSSG